MKLRYIIDIDIDEEDTEMELKLVDDIRNFVRDHEYGCIANGVDVKLQDEYCIQKEQDLINRQKAEIERLKVDLVKCSIRIDNLYKTADEIKSEAIKELAKRLKHFIIPQKADGYTREIVLKRDIDNLVKVMTEGQE